MHAAAGTACQEIAGPVVEERIAHAGVRLAMIINEAAKGGGSSHAIGSVTIFCNDCRTRTFGKCWSVW